ncbi:hypothetical protein AB0392_32575 [Nonomuraea angiospora]|uniref:hypothetical protein n=1 Tax=Nonomuraea angiospora TaxID=46172 RepID=UPI00344CCF33
MYDIFEDIAALLHRLPSASTRADDPSSCQPTPSLTRLREAEVLAMTEAHHAADESDPLLDKLRELTALKREIDERLSHLIVYSRHFVWPRPYQLSVVAKATGLSISGVRAISGRRREMEEVARNLERSDIKGILTPGEVRLEKSLANLEALASKQEWPTVVYRLAGTASSADVTVKRATDTKKITSVKLPAELSYRIPPGAPVHVSLQNTATEGSVSCEITVDGTVISRDEADGAYVIASCNGTVP